MTNSKTSQCGIYELPEKIMILETGYNQETVSKLLNKFIKYGKIKYDRSTKEVAIINWRKHNSDSSPKVKARIRTELTIVKSKELLVFMQYEDQDALTKANRNYRVSEKTRNEIFNRDENKCTKCGATDFLTIDHIYPRNLGGLSDKDNLRTLCRSCNSKRPLFGDELKEEIIASGYDYDKLKLAYQYPIGRELQEEPEEEEEPKEEPEPKEEEKKEVLSQWNSFAKEVGLATILKLSNKRLKAIGSRLSEKEFNLIEIFEGIKKSDFLQGKNDRGWKVDFDFIFCSANNYLKILEGKYANNKGSISKPNYVSPEEISDGLKQAFSKSRAST